MGIAFVYAPHVYWKMGVYQNATPAHCQVLLIVIFTVDYSDNFELSLNAKSWVVSHEMFLK